MISNLEGRDAQGGSDATADGRNGGDPLRSLLLLFFQDRARQAHLYDALNNKTVATVHLKVDPTFFPCRPLGQKLIESKDANMCEGIFTPAYTSDDNFSPPDWLEIHFIDDTVAPRDQLPMVTFTY